MTSEPSIQEARSAALTVLLHNVSGPYHGLPRTAGWGYPEPYTRDLLISALGILVSDNAELHQSVKTVLESLARNQSPRGQIPSLVHDREDRGASDTTPLFLLILGMFRRISGQPAFLEEACLRALTWMEYQTIDDRDLVGQLPTSDWRDEQWVLGYGLFVNALVHGYLRVLGLHDKATRLRSVANRDGGCGFAIDGQATYALWFYKVLRDEGCDVLGNSVAILTGLADRERARAMVAQIERDCAEMRRKGELGVDLPPCFFPFVHPSDPNWHPRYAIYNPPGHYHNGGVWPFVCGFYIAALVAAGEHELAVTKLLALTALVRPSRRQLPSPPGTPGAHGFNEWFHARDGSPAGEDWQTWSASMYLYAVACVESRQALLFPLNAT